MSDPEVVDLTVEVKEDRKSDAGPAKPSAGSAPQLDLAALARERDGRTSSSARAGGAREKRRRTSVRTARSSR